MYLKAVVLQKLNAEIFLKRHKAYGNMEYMNAFFYSKIFLCNTFAYENNYTALGIYDSEKLLVLSHILI